MKKEIAFFEINTGLMLRCFHIFLIFLFASVAGAQDFNDTDEAFLFWSGAKINFNLKPKWKINFEQQLRLQSDDDIFEKSVTELGMRYLPESWLHFALSFRLSLIHEVRNRGRVVADTHFRFKVENSPLWIDYRIRIQNATVIYTGQHITHLRNRLKFLLKRENGIKPYFFY